MTTKEKIDDIVKKHECDLCNYGCFRMCDACEEIVDYIEEKILEKIKCTFDEMSENYFASKNITNLIELKNLINDTIRKTKGILNY